MNLAANLRLGALWDLFFPPICSLCDGHLEREDLFFCRRCWDRCESAQAEDLPPFKHVDFASVTFRMHHSSEDPVRSIVHALKYDGRRVLAPNMARRLARALPQDFLQRDALWVPVPQYWVRRWQRGFNQSFLLARGLQRELKVPLETKLLRRIRHTRSQTHLTPSERRKNVQNAFRVSQAIPIPDEVILIDDVITTGATMEECARTLKKAGVKWVGAAAFAKAKP
jgi:ComF family protein